MNLPISAYLSLLPRLIAAASLGAVASFAGAQSYPAKPITMVVAFAPGGTSDITTRILAKKLAESLGSPVVVENRAGAGGVIGWSSVARAAPDGYTLLALETSYAMSAAVMPKLPFDPRKDLAQVSTTLSVPFVMVVNASLPARDVASFVALAKSKPGALNYGSGGTATSSHLAGEWFKSLTTTDIVHVPYKGGGAFLQELVGGQVQLGFPAVPSAHPHIKSGKLRALMVTSEKRNAALPEVASAPEAGLPKMIGVNWFGVAAPAGTPAAIVSRLNKEIAAALVTPEAQQRFADQGLDAVGSSPAAAAKFVEDEIQRWSALAASAKIRIE